MPAARQRRAPLIYIAGSARELPPSMQEWLGRADVRAVASSGIYDVLALLARRKRFQAIVVHMDAVDWSEMDFFDHAARLSQGVPIYVVGQPHHAAKLEAACRRGAQPFDVDMLSERLKYPEVPVAAEQDEADSVDVADAAEEADEVPVIAFPWTVNVNRPKRTPPRQSPPDDPQGNPAEPERGSGRERKFTGVRLTAEEIAALMGRPPGDAAPPGKEAQA